MSRNQPYEKPRVVKSVKLPPWFTKARLAWMVLKGMSVEDAVRMIGAKAVDLARDTPKDQDTAKSSDVK